MTDLREELAPEIGRIRHQTWTGKEWIDIAWQDAVKVYEPYIVARAVAAEREACAKVIEDGAFGPYAEDVHEGGAAAIRARGPS